MTQTIDVPLGTLPPQERVDAWLADFAAALAARNIDRVVEQFAVDSFWRDLVAFTWNIKTVEGRDGIADMLTARLADADPSGFRTREAPTEEFDGDEVVTSAFIEFETAIGRGVGHLRLRGEQAWTLLTALQELKGHEERKGPKRVLGAVHGSEPDSRSWAEKKHDEERSLGYTEQPSVVVVGGGQGSIALGARLRQLQVPTIVVDRHEGPEISGASATSRYACTTRSGTTTCHTCRSRRTGRCSRRRGSGYYIDVGTSDLIAGGDIKLAHGQVERLTEDSVVVKDGTELPADLVVYATGFGSMNGWAADLIGQDIADKVGKVWGLGSGTTKDPGPWEGEQRNMWKPTQQENLWFHGGNLHQSRHYSLYLALQLKARHEGIPTPVYGLQEVHHLS
jgi:hypothetical protein